MKGSSGYSNPHQASCPANSERAPPSYEEVAGSSMQFGDAGKSLPTQFPPAYTEQEQNVRVVYLPAPNFGPKSAKVICSSCQVQWSSCWQMPHFNSLYFSGNCHYFDEQSAKYDGLGGLLCPLLHHAVALLLRPLLHRQLQGCEAQLPQLQCYPWTL